MNHASAGFLIPNLRGDGLAMARMMSPEIKNLMPANSILLPVMSGSMP